MERNAHTHDLVPLGMAMQGPSTWIIRDKADDGEAATLAVLRLMLMTLADDHDSISSVQLPTAAFLRKRTVELSRPSSNHPEVMPVQVPRMRLASAITSGIILQHYVIDLAFLECVDAFAPFKLFLAGRVIVE